MNRKKNDKTKINNKKIAGLILIVVALILIAFSGTKLLNAYKTINGKYANEVTDREYRSVTKIAKDANINMDMNLIKDTAKQVGFKKIDCEAKYCTASNMGYKSEKYQDAISVNFDEDNSFSNMTLMIYYSKKDFNYDNLYKDVNAIVGNYVGLEISKADLEKIDIPSENEEVNQNNYKKSKFTIESSLQFIVEEGLYVYRNFIIETEKYV